MKSLAKLFLSLKHGDPQAVAFTAVFVFLLSVCWFSWTFLFPPKDNTLPFGGGRFGEPPPEKTVSLKEVLDVQRVFLTPEDVPNPFFREPPQRRQPPERNQEKNIVDKEDQPSTNESKPDGNQNSLPSNPPVNVQPKTRSLTLTYQGLLTRPDDTTVAFISITESGSSDYLQAGEKVDIFTLLEITPEGIQLQKEDEQAIYLPRGETQSFEVPL